jgi:hypothetical protein
MNINFVPLSAWWVGWLHVLIPAGMVGLCGIMEAFLRVRRMALVCGVIAGLAALAFLASLACFVWAEPEPATVSGYINCLWMGLFPLCTAVWSILLAYLVPDKLRRTEARDEWPRVAP